MGTIKSMKASLASSIAESGHSRYWQAFATLFLVLLSIYTYFAYTARATEHYRYLFVDLKVTPRINATVDTVVAVVFLFEFLRRLQKGLDYILSVFFWFDLLAWVPGLVHGFVYFHVAKGEGRVNEVLCSLVVLRILKMEKFTGALRMTCRVMYKERSLLLAAFVVASVTWMLFSVLFYLSEMSNPDAEIFENYGSIMRSTWAEVINLHGEYPWADYTATGKALGTIVAFFAILLFCIPISICSNGFQEMLDEEAEERREASVGVDRAPWQKRFRPLREGISQAAYDLLYSHLHHTRNLPKSFVCLRAAVVITTLGSMLVTIMGTSKDEDLAEWKEGFHYWGYWFDFDSAIFFGAVFFVQIMAMGVTHVVSFPGFCDFVSLLAIVTSLIPAFRDQCFHPKYRRDLSIIDDGLVLVRCLRLFTLESYFHVLHVLKNVITINRWPLFRALCLTITVWYLHVTVLFLCEHDWKGDDGESSYHNGWYIKGESSDAVVANETEDPAEALLQLLGGVARPAMHPAGAAAAGWLTKDGAAKAQALMETLRTATEAPTEESNDRVEDEEDGDGKSKQDESAEQEEEREEEEEEEEEVTMHQRYESIPRALQYSIVHLSGDYPETDYNFYSKCIHFVGIIVGMAIISTFCGVFTASFVQYLQEERRLQLRDRARERMLATSAKVMLIQRYLKRRLRNRGRPAVAPQGPRADGLTLFCRSVCTSSSAAGRGVMALFNAVLVLNLINSLLLSVPQIAREKQALNTFLLFESVCTVFFIVEFFIRIKGAPRGRISRWRLLDLVCLAPGILTIIEYFSGSKTINSKDCPWVKSALRSLLMVRAFRLIDFPLFNKEVNIIMRAVADASSMLAIPAYAALNCWIVFSAAFMWVENYYEGAEGEFVSEAEHMHDMPASMYWMCIFLLGEWANVDFTYAGSRLSILTVYIGVALFSVPVGILVEAVQNQLEQQNLEDVMIKKFLKGELNLHDMDDVAGLKERLRSFKKEAMADGVGDGIGRGPAVAWPAGAVAAAAPPAVWRQGAAPLAAAPVDASAGSAGYAAGGADFPGAVPPGQGQQFSP